eukprot:1156388-Pelagomonas_calceolata.AAC.1
MCIHIPVGMQVVWDEKIVFTPCCTSRRCPFTYTCAGAVLSPAHAQVNANGVHAQVDANDVHGKGDCTRERILGAFCPAASRASLYRRKTLAPFALLQTQVPLS